MSSPEDTGVRGRARTRSSVRPDGARHRGASPSLRDRLRTFARSGAGALAVAGAVLVLGLVGAVFSSTTQNPPNVYTAAQLDAYVPSAVTATRTSSTTCLVSWTPVASPPAGMTYDVTDGSGTTVVAGASGTSASATVPVTAVTPTVKARRGSWVSTASTAASSPCLGWPDAPGSLTLTPSDGAVAASWTAPAANGGTLASYTAVISPAPSSGSATCTATVPTTSCSWSNLTNGLTYTVSVTATSNVGTGPATTATAIPYPSTVMSTSNLTVWLDGADASTMFASNTCAGAAPTTSIGCWVDKSSGGGHNATGSSTSLRPAPTTVAGRSVPGFDGTDDYLGIGNLSTLPAGTTASTTFVAASLTDPAPASSGYRTAVFWGEAASGQGRQFFKNASSAAATVDGYLVGGTSPGTWTSAVGILVGEHTSTLVTGWMNGAPGTTSSATSLSTVVARANVGRQTSTNGYYWQGPIPEVIVLGSTVTAAQRRSVEEYLSRKWSSLITPGQPTGVAATPSTTADATASIAWTAPSYDGGSAITSYTVTATPSDGTLPTVTQSCASSPCTVTGFTDGALYTVTVTANNAIGAGPASSGVSLTTYPAGTAMTTAATQLWLDGADGATLLTSSGCTGATATSGGAVGCWKDKSSQADNATQSTGANQATVSTLNSRTTPSFDGTNDFYGLTVAKLPTGTTPSTIWSVAAQEDTAPASSDFRHVIGWGSTATGQGRVIEKGSFNSSVYLETYGTWPSASPTKTWPVGSAALVDGTVTSSSVTSNVNGATNYTMSVSNNTGTGSGATVGATAWNTGNGVWKGRIAEVVVTNTAATATQNRVVQEYLARKWGVVITPGTPTSMTAAASTTSDGTATVTWAAPSWNGGAAVTGYTVTAVPSDGTLSTVSQSCTSPCTVSGLTNGVTYTVSVTATNSVGTGPAATTTVIPYPASIMTAARMRLWLDGADTATMYQSSGCTGSLAAAASDPVGCWVDKSGQTNNATQPSNTAWRPALATLGSRLVPSFDGTNDWYTLTVSKFPTGSTASSMSFVAKLTAATGYRNLLSWGTLTSGTARAQYLDSGPVKADTYTAGPTASQGSVSNGTFFQATTAYSATTTSVAFNAATATTSAAGSVNTGSAGGFAAMGGAAGMSYYWTGPIPETIVFTGTVTAAEQRTIDEYLARKWGTTIVPAAPTNVTATASTTTDGAADVAWTTPSWNGGSAISSYNVTATPADGTAATVTKSCASSPCTVTGLTNGALYTVTVQAVSSAGSSYTAAASTTVTPYPAATFSANTLGLWLDGADSTTLYSNTGCTTAAGTSTGSAVACWKDRSGNARNATAVANAAVGSTLNGRATVAFSGTSQLGVARPASGSMTLFAVPRTAQTQGSGNWYNGATLFDGDVSGANTNDYGLTLVGGAAAFGTGNPDTTAKSGTTVNNSAGHVVVGRRSVSGTAALEASADGGARGTNTSANIANLTTPTTVYLGKSAGGITYVGDLGEVVVLGSAASRADERTVVEYLARKWGFSITPSAPSAVTVNGADAQATVTWTAPWNGYSAITGYTVTATPVDGSLSTITQSCTSPCTVTGMTNGATYSFVVTATNAVGTGPGSTAVSASAYPATLFAAADLKVWLDAQYDGALSAATDCSGSGATSGVVGCWKDRSGNGWNAPAASGASGATLTSSAINGRTALRFSKTTSTMYRVSAAGIGAVGGADRSVFATGVGRSVLGTASTHYAGVVASWNTGYQSAVLVKSYNGTTTTADYVQGDAYNSSAGGIFGGGSYTASAPFLVSSVLSSSGGTLTNSTRLSGNGLATSSSVAGTWMSYGDALVVGAADSNLAVDYAYPLDGDLGEVLVFDRALTASERRTVEEYLARHWGQTIGPSAPTLSTVTKPSSGQLTASWSAPTGWNGGAAVTGYTASASASGQTTRTCSTAGTSCTITGLTAGVTYSVVVAATNSTGAGAASNAINGTA